MPHSQRDYLLCINKVIDERLSLLASRDFFAHAENHLKNACAHLSVSDHAKRIRPLVCLYYHELFQEDFDERLVDIAVAAEFIHTASLLHDDIIDDAERRRGKHSVNRIYGNKIAVLAGDYLLSEAFKLLLSKDRVLVDKAIMVVSEMTKAAVAEFNARGNMDVGVADLQKIAVGKTGYLFSWCGFAVSILCGRPDMTDSLWQLGKHIGIIFQLADDIKDFDGDHALKDVGRDLRNLDLSVPILLAAQEDQGVMQELQRLAQGHEVSDEKVNQLGRQIQHGQALIKTRTMMSHEIEKALTIIGALPASKSRDNLTRFVTALGLCVY